MEMEMNLMERLVALQMLPAEGNFASLKSLRVAKETLALTAEEVEEFEFKQEDERAMWNIKGSEDRPIKLEEFAVQAIKSKLKKLDDDNKLEDKHFSLYEKFVGGK